MPYLPPEIWMMVIDHLEYQKEIAALCLVSKAFNAICTPILYVSPVTAPTTAAFFRTVAESPHLARQIKQLPVGFDDFSIDWEDLSPQSMDLFNCHIKTVREIEIAVPEDTPRSSVSGPLHFLYICHKQGRIPLELCQSVLLSSLPNLEEATLQVLKDMLLASAYPGSLTKLKNFTIANQVEWSDDGDILGDYHFSSLKFLAEAAAALENLSISGVSFDMTRYNYPRAIWRHPFCKSPHRFPAVINLNLSGVRFSGLTTSAAFVIMGFPRLQSFRFDASRMIDTPSQPKIEQLLRALSLHTPRLQHFCLRGAINYEHNDVRDAAQGSKWPQTLYNLSQLGTLETLSIDCYSLWPFEDGTTRPDDLLLNFLPQSLRHLHIDDEDHELYDTQIWILDFSQCFRKLAKAISQDEKFKCLELISFPMDLEDDELSKAFADMKEAGVSLVRRDCPWKSTGLYKGN